MRALRRVVWLLLAIAVVIGVVYVAGNDELIDRLSGVLLTIQLGVPLSFDFERFLVILTALSLLAVLLVILGAIAVTLRLSLFYRRKLNLTAAAQRETSYLREQQQREFQQLRLIEQALTKRLDRRVLIQTIIEAASRVTSVPQTNSLVSCWMLNFETETLRFEKGLYCDETMFVQAEFQPNEAPFSRVMASQRLWMSPVWSDGMALVKPEKAAQLGTATAVMVLPLIAEASVLGLLVMFCHPDVLRSYEIQKPFYEVVWGELSLALAIAVQGEVAILDRLTGVHNREYFMKRLTQEAERANRYQFPLSLLMLDIDNFKLVNDMLGHPQGDAVLKIVAKLIKKSVRPIDLVGRYGGEEFVVMLPETGYGGDLTNLAGAPIVAERIRKAIDDEFRGLQKPLDLTISVGVALRRFPEDRDMDYQTLVRLADEQLYRAKAAGKNRVCVLVPEKSREVL
ncbi:MAG: GGDEF domain-containing protein [Candidatus Omnitrophica bacterium]|nr:GGDEF domain-containing protein [Candidatus Omnitrophota bacterium]